MGQLVSNDPASISSQFIKFAWVGLASSALQYLVLILFVHFGALRPAFASAIGYGLGACLSYFLNYHFTFASRAGHSGAVIRFGVVAAIGFALNFAIVVLANETLGVNYLLAQTLATALVLGWNFIANRRWTFGANKNAREPK